VTVVHLPDIVGGGYGPFWHHRGRYRVVKGGRGSKKSTTAALWFIFHLMRAYHVEGLRPSLLVIRRYFNTHAGSTFNQLWWAINRLGVAPLWRRTKSPLKLTYLPSGQHVYFRGLDDAQSITSIVADDGHLCWAWWEEAFQVTREEDFDMVDMSLRGSIDERLFYQHTITMNPWSDKHWIKRRFFDEPPEGTLAITRNYDCNEFLDAQYLHLFETMKVNNPRRFAIEGRGDWGISEGLIYENWEEREFNFADLLSRGQRAGIAPHYGLDFGFTNDPTAFVAMAVDKKNRTIYVGNEIYRTGMSNMDIFDAINALGCARVRIVADSSDPRTISELRALGLTGIEAAKKGPDSVIAGIQKLQDYRLVVHPRCVNTQVELCNYVWSRDRLTGRLMNAPVDEYNHIMDAMRYGTEPVNRETFRW
jgi:phage terminase large subunit